MFKKENRILNINNSYNSDVPIKFVSLEIPTRKLRIQYPCLCNAINKLLTLIRCTGVLPIILPNRELHGNQCEFAVSKIWLSYSIILQFLYICYFLYAYGGRLLQGPPDYHQSEWYVVTIGYTFFHLECIAILLGGKIFARRICNLLQQLSIMPGRIGEMRTLEKQIKITMIGFLFGNSALLVSYTLVFCYRYGFYNESNQTVIYDILDSWIGMLMRGLSTVFPTLQVIISLSFYSIIWRKFDYLATLTDITINKLHNQRLEKSKNTSKIYIASDSIRKFSDDLEQLTEFHGKLHDSLNELNDCMGLQLVLIISGGLYISVCYSYRYATSINETLFSNEQERFHYILTVIYCVIEMIAFMVTGQIIYSKSLQPLRIVQKARLVNLPTAMQQQVQTLLLQWNGRIGYLNVYGAVHIGPWLLPPIIGSVITYLLVALQFTDTENNNFNVSTLLDSF